MKNRKHDIKVINGTCLDRMLGSVKYLELDGIRYQHAEHWYLGDIFKEVLIGDHNEADKYMYLPSPQSGVYSIDTVHQIKYKGIRMLVITFSKNPRYYEEFGGRNLLNHALELAYNNIEGTRYLITDYRFGLDDYIKWFIDGYAIIGDALADIAYKDNILTNMAFHSLVKANKPITYENVEYEIYRQWGKIKKNPRNIIDFYNKKVSMKDALKS